MRKILLLSLVVFCSVSCREKGNVVSVPKPDYADPHLFDAEKYADSVRFVRLETTDDNLIGSVGELFFTDDYIIVVDNRQTSSIFFFDHDGNYSHKIHRQGRGPGEYLDFFHVLLDREREVLYLYDISKQAMQLYDFEGNFLSAIENFGERGNPPGGIYLLPSGDFLCYNQEDIGQTLSEEEPELTSDPKSQAGLWLVKSDGRFDRFVYPVVDTHSIYVPPYHLSALPDGGISFVDQNQPAVFHVHGDQVTKVVEFEMPGNTAADFTYPDILDQSYYFMFGSQEKGDFIFTEWIDDQDREFSTIFTKSTGEVETGLNFGPVAFGQYLPYGTRFVRNNDPYICSSWFSPALVDEYIKDNPEHAPEAQKLIEGIPAGQIENSNPILQLLYIKR